MSEAEVEQEVEYSEAAKAVVGISLIAVLGVTAVMTDGRNARALQTLGWIGVALSTIALAAVVAEGFEFLRIIETKWRRVLVILAAIICAVAGCILLAFRDPGMDFSLGRSFPSLDKLVFSAGPALLALGSAVLAQAVSENARVKSLLWLSAMKRGWV